MDAKDLIRGGLMGLTTDVVGTPVDLMSMLLYQMGYKEPKPVMGSEWLADKLGVKQTGSVPEQAARVVTGLLSPGPGELAQIGPLLGAIKAYHGSPHKFDKFDLSKIGTGEGAHAYGPGAYFAENPGVAKDYAWNLSQRSPERIKLDGKPVSPDTILGRAIEDVGLVGKKAALQKIDDSIKFNEKYAPDMANMYRSIREIVADVDPSKVNVNKGEFYEASLRWPDAAREAADPLGPQHFLDWDVPFSNQPATVQDVLKSLGIGEKWTESSLRGGEAFKRLVSRGDSYKTMGVNSQANLQDAINATAQLKNKGIPGIRYLDAGSRGAGEGTANYVVFDDALIEILKRNGLDIK